MLKLEAGKFLGENKSDYDANGIIVSETEYHRRVFEGWHAHANHHLTLILRGGNRERRGNREFEALPGQILFYRRGEFHRNTGTLHPSKNINLEIEDEFLTEYGAFVSDAGQFQANARDAKFALLKIYKECRNRDVLTTATIHSLALMLLDSTFEEKLSGKLPSWTNGLREIINDRWNEVLSLDELSRALGVHPVTISKSFPKYFSCTLGEYARKVKIEKAVVLINHSHLSLADIAYKCGFADQSHFTRAFKSLTGLTPREFKILSG